MRYTIRSLLVLTTLVAGVLPWFYSLGGEAQLALVVAGQAAAELAFYGYVWRHRRTRRHAGSGESVQSA